MHPESTLRKHAQSRQNKPNQAKTIKPAASKSPSATQQAQSP
jgi:hypothetical protein